MTQPPDDNRNTFAEVMRLVSSKAAEHGARASGGRRNLPAISPDMDTDKRRSALRESMFGLASTSTANVYIDPLETLEYVEFFRTYFQDGKRPSYLLGDVCQIIYDIRIGALSAGAEGPKHDLEVLSNNMKAVADRARQASAGDDLTAILDQVSDYISQEQIRMSFAIEADKALQEHFDKQQNELLDLAATTDAELKETVANSEARINKTVTENINSLNEQQDKSANKFKKFKKAIKRISDDTQRTSVTMLGVFAGIAFTLVAAIGFGQSVLQGLSSMSIYRYLFTTTGVAFVLFNMFALLFSFVLQVNGKELGDTPKAIAIAFNAICILVIIIDFLLWCCSH